MRKLLSTVRPTQKRNKENALFSSGAPKHLAGDAVEVQTTEKD